MGEQVKTTKQILLRAARLLETKGWTRGWFARDGHGNKVLHSSRRASRFCAEGAIFRCGGGADCRDALRAAADCDNIAHWNDDPKRKKSEVIAALRKAAGRVE